MEVTHWNRPKIGWTLHVTAHVEFIHHEYAFQKCKFWRAESFLVNDCLRTLEEVVIVLFENVVIQRDAGSRSHGSVHMKAVGVSDFDIILVGQVTKGISQPVDFFL